MQPEGTLATVHRTFLGPVPDWYKGTIIVFLILNPLALWLAGPVVCGWLVLLEFIFTLALSLKCYPLQPGGLIALEAVVLGLATPAAVYDETKTNFPVILLMIFMVAGIYFLREVIIFLFTRLFIAVRSKVLLSFLFCLTAAVLSAFLDALTVIAMVIVVATGLYDLHHAFSSRHSAHPTDEAKLRAHAEFEQFQGFLRSLVMHAAIGTALGGVTTMVGEPQNLLIASAAGWDFTTFFHKMAPVSLPVLAAGLLTCILVESLGWFGFGATLPASIRAELVEAAARQDRQTDPARAFRLWTQGAVALLLVAGLALHVAEVGLIGLTVIVLATALCGITDEKKLGHAFAEALPFTALLVVFFVIVAVIHTQGLFQPIIAAVLAQEGRGQVASMYLANGVLSAISDNVFVASVYMSEVKNAFTAGAIDRAQFDLLAIAVNTGTNIPSVATPNGQAAFLFLLTSGLAGLIRLGYGRMLWMALPFTLVMTVTGLAAVFNLA